MGHITRIIKYTEFIPSVQFYPTVDLPHSLVPIQVSPAHLLLVLFLRLGSDHGSPVRNLFALSIVRQVPLELFVWGLLCGSTGVLRLVLPVIELFVEGVEVVPINANVQPIRESIDWLQLWKLFDFILRQILYVHQFEPGVICPQQQPLQHHVPEDERFLALCIFVFEEAVDMLLEQEAVT